MYTNEAGTVFIIIWFFRGEWRDKKSGKVGVVYCSWAVIGEFSICAELKILFVGKWETHLIDTTKNSIVRIIKILTV